MTDIVSAPVRSRMMSGIRGKDTKPEMLVRRFLHGYGFRYKVHDKNLPGKPDIVLPKYRTVIFIHGCFWHQHRKCKYAAMPKSNHAFWKSKLDGNVTRDRKIVSQLKKAGWDCHTIWECQISKTYYLAKLKANIFH